MSTRKNYRNRAMNGTDIARAWNSVKFQAVIHERLFFMASNKQLHVYLA